MTKANGVYLSFSCWKQRTSLPQIDARSGDTPKGMLLSLGNGYSVSQMTIFSLAVRTTRIVGNLLYNAYFSGSIISCMLFFYRIGWKLNGICGLHVFGWHKVHSVL